jgi:hypothetical protein
MTEDGEKVLKNVRTSLLTNVLLMEQRTGRVSNLGLLHIFGASSQQHSQNPECS